MSPKLYVEGVCSFKYQIDMGGLAADLAVALLVEAEVLHGLNRAFHVVRCQFRCQQSQDCREQDGDLDFNAPQKTL